MVGFTSTFGYYYSTRWPTLGCMFVIFWALNVLKLNEWNTCESNLIQNYNDIAKSKSNFIFGVTQCIATTISIVLEMLRIIHFWSLNWISLIRLNGVFWRARIIIKPPLVCIINDRVCRILFTRRINSRCQEEKSMRKISVLTLIYSLEIIYAKVHRSNYFASEA